MQNRFSPQLLSENTEVRIILLVMCFETWSSTLREERGLCGRECEAEEGI